MLDEYSYYNEHIVDFCLGVENNFLERQFSDFNRIEIDLSNQSFFAEKLEVKLHLQKT